jgi:hypothetical protein
MAIMVEHNAEIHNPLTENVHLIAGEVWSVISVLVIMSIFGTLFPLHIDFVLSNGSPSIACLRAGLASKERDDVLSSFLTNMSHL